MHEDEQRAGWPPARNVAYAFQIHRAVRTGKAIDFAKRGAFRVFQMHPFPNDVIGFHCWAIPSSVISLPHLSSSSFTKAEQSAGSEVTRLAPKAANFFFISGFSTALLIS